MEKLFPNDRMSKRERVKATLNHQPVDRVALHDQVSFNPRVIEMCAGRAIKDFDYTVDDVCAVIRKTLDMCFPPVAPRGAERVSNPDGFVFQHDNWTTWLVSRPFTDEEGARAWLAGRIRDLRNLSFDAGRARREYREYMLNLQSKVGDTVICDYPVDTGLCGVYGDTGMGLEIFSYFYADYPELLQEFMELYNDYALKRVHAIADAALAPVILIAEDFATKQGPIFAPEFLRRHHYPYIRRQAAAWHEHGYKVLYHSDGNWKKAIPDLMAGGVDGFYCLEPNCGMDIVELKNKWPAMVWAGGVDGVDLLERGTPAQVKTEVQRQIRETNALQTGGLFVASSSEINPPIKPENFKAMVAAVGETLNPEFCRPEKAG